MRTLRVALLTVALSGLYACDPFSAPHYTLTTNVALSGAAILQQRALVISAVNTARAVTASTDQMLRDRR